MRAKKTFTYVIEQIFCPEEIFTFIQSKANISSREIYETLNMGSDYAVFVPKKDVDKAKTIVRENSFEALDAGYVKEGTRQVILKPIDITFQGSRLDFR